MTSPKTFPSAVLLVSKISSAVADSAAVRFPHPFPYGLPLSECVISTSCDSVCACDIIFKAHPNQRYYSPHPTPPTPQKYDSAGNPACYFAGDRPAGRYGQPAGPPAMHY